MWRIVHSPFATAPELAARQPPEGPVPGRSGAPFPAGGLYHLGGLWRDRRCDPGLAHRSGRSRAGALDALGPSRVHDGARRLYELFRAQYGGSTTAILVNIPGENSSVVTCIDGHMMARKGRAGSALAIAARQLVGVSGAADLRQLSRAEPAFSDRRAVARHSHGSRESISGHLRLLRLLGRLVRLALSRRSRLILTFARSSVCRRWSTQSGRSSLSCGTGEPHRRVQRTGTVDTCETTAEIGQSGSDQPGRQIGRRNPVFSHGLV
jgi:hypothetical protein